MKDWIRKGLTALILSGIACGISLGIWALVENWDAIVEHQRYLDSTEDYRAEVIDKDESHWMTLIPICGEDGCTYIPIWHHSYRLQLNNTKTLSVSMSTYNSINIGDTIIVYLSGRIEKVDG